MARQDEKKKKDSKKNNDDRSGESHFGWSDARPYVLGFLAVIAIPTVIIAWIVGMPRLETYASASTVTANYQRPAVVTFTHEPNVIIGVDQTLLEMAYALAQADPLDRNILISIRQAMIDSAWFDPKTLRVSRDLVADPETGETFDQITIDGPIRQPYARVRSGSIDYLVDITGTRLPISVQSIPPAQADLMIAITGTETPPPKPGTIWPGSDVADGLAIIRLFYKPVGPDNKTRPWLDQVDSIDVSNADGSRRDRPGITIVSDRGGRVIWGRAIGKEFGVEIPAHEKLRLLDLEYAERRRIDHAQGDLRINLPVTTVQQPQQKPITPTG